LTATPAPGRSGSGRVSTSPVQRQDEKAAGYAGQNDQRRGRGQGQTRPVWQADGDQSQGGWRGEQTKSQKVTNQHSPCLKAKVVHSAHMGGREGYWQREQQKEG